MWPVNNQIVSHFFVPIKTSTFLYPCDLYSLLLAVSLGIYSLWVLSYTIHCITVISWRSVLLIEETRIQVKNNQPAASKRQHSSHLAILICPHLDSNIPTAPAYRVYISQLVRHTRAHSLYSDFLQRHRLLSTKLLNQGFLKNHLVLC